VGLDLTLGFLSRFVADFSSEGTLLLFNDQNQLIAHPKLVDSRTTSVGNVDDIIPDELKDSFREALADSRQGPRFHSGYLVLSRKLQNAPWTALFIAHRMDLERPAYSAVGFAFSLVAAGLIAMLVMGQKTIRRDFVMPGQKLVDHIGAESRNEQPPRPDVPEAWQPCFDEVSTTFRQNLA